MISCPLGPSTDRVLKLVMGKNPGLAISYCSSTILNVLTMNYTLLLFSVTVLVLAAVFLSTRTVQLLKQWSSSHLYFVLSSGP